MDRLRVSSERTAKDWEGDWSKTQAWAAWGWFDLSGVCLPTRPTSSHRCPDGGLLENGPTGPRVDYFRHHPSKGSSFSDHKDRLKNGLGLPGHGT